MKTKKSILIVAGIITALAVIAGAAFLIHRNAEPDEESRETTGEIALESLKDVAGESRLLSLADLSDVASQESPETYIEENSEYEMDDDAIKEYVQNYLTALESTAADSNVTPTALVQEMGYEGIEEYEATVTGMVEDFVKQRLAVYTIAEQEKISLSKSQYESLVESYMAEYGYEDVETFEKECIPLSIANEMLFDVTLDRISGKTATPDAGAVDAGTGETAAGTDEPDAE